MQVALLGPVEVRNGAGVAREVSGTRLRALLVLLAGPDRSCPLAS